MRKQDSKTPRRGAAAGTLAVTRTLALALALALTWSVGTAFAAEDEEEVPLDTKLMRQFLKDLGLQRDGEGIEYRERAPLVVPPSRNLPPPQSTGTVANNPAWPKDPDVNKRKVEAAKKKQPNRTAGEAADAEARPLSRTELDRGRTAAGSTQPGGTVTKDADADASRALRPNELGSKSLFSNMFSSAPWADKTEVGSFSGEPTRENLTAPPPGYQTPSPNQPYGLGPSRDERKGLTLEQRTAGENR